MSFSGYKALWWIILAMAAPFAKSEETACVEDPTIEAVAESPVEMQKIGEALRFLANEEAPLDERVSTAFNLLTLIDGVDAAGNETKIPDVARTAAFLFLNDQGLGFSSKPIECPEGQLYCSVSGAEGWPFLSIKHGQSIDFDAYFAGTAIKWAYQDASATSFTEGAALAAHLADPKAAAWVGDLLAEQADKGGKSWGAFLQAYEQASALVYYSKGCTLLENALGKATTAEGKKRLSEVWYAANCEAVLVANVADNDACTQTFPEDQTDFMKALYTLQCVAIREHTEATEAAIRYFWFVMTEPLKGSAAMEQLRFLSAAMLLGTEAQVPDWMRGTALMGMMGYLENQAESMEALSPDTALWPRMLAAHWALRLSREGTSAHTWVRSHVFGLMMGSSQVRQLAAARGILETLHTGNYVAAVGNLETLCRSEYSDNCPAMCAVVQVLEGQALELPLGDLGSARLLKLLEAVCSE